VRRTVLSGVLAVLALAIALAVPASGGASGAHATARARACHKGFVRRHGRCVCPTGRVRKGTRCVVRRRPALTPNPTPNPTPGTTPGSPSPGTPATPPAAQDGPPFSPPGHDITGTEAANAILPFLANSTFTDCPAGFPACAVEERYGHFANATMFYCRLTPSPGSDIINSGHSFQIIGADQKADGSWAATLQVLSYGNQYTYYTWSVSTTGVATGLYWGPGANPQTDAPSQQLGPLRWVRGARDCSY
jgi:hypothetical protein